MHPKKVPNLVYSDENGQILDISSIEVAGRSGKEILRLKPDDFIEMPDGSELFLLPNRNPVGFHRKTGEKFVFQGGSGVAAFIAPAHTQFYMAAYQTNSGAPRLPIFAYTAVGWLGGKFYVPATRIDPDIRQDCEHFNQDLVIQSVKKELKKNTKNRLLHHLGENCALTYLCPAARNFFMKRWEAPLPTSPACNCRCVACISLQPKDSSVPAPQDRICFTPTADEVAEVALMHIKVAPRPVVSFGQGCEGEPLLVWELLRDSIKEIRKHTKEGIINLNTNGSLPNAVDKLFEAGLDSIRISMNSARKGLYNAYYRPVNYTHENVIESLMVARERKKWSSLNYFVFPGVNDQIDEYEALKELIKKTNLSMIQWRNFNIDPEWYYESVGEFSQSQKLSMQGLLKTLKEDFPHLAYGYFNPPQEVISYYQKLS